MGRQTKDVASTGPVHARADFPGSSVKENESCSPCGPSGQLRSRIRARIKGLLEEVHFVEGTEVDASAPLYTIDPREYRTAISRATADEAKARADIANWKAQIQLAQTEHQRLIRSPGEAVTQSEIDKARVWCSRRGPARRAGSHLERPCLPG